MKKLYLVVLPLLIACTSESDKAEESNGNESAPKGEVVIQSSYRDLNVDEFSEYTYDPNAVVLDVRTEGEWNENGIIPGAKMVDWYDEQFAEKVADIPKDKSIYVYCHGGGRSAQAAEKLIEMGYNDVFNLENGFASWAAAGKPIEKDSL